MKNYVLFFVMIAAAIPWMSCRNSDPFSEMNDEKAKGIAHAALAMPVDSVLYGTIGGDHVLVARVVDTASYKVIKDNVLKILRYSDKEWNEVTVHYSQEDEGDIEKGAITDISLVNIDGKDYIYYSIDSPDFYGHDGGRKDYVVMTYPECKPLALSYRTNDDERREIVNEKNKTAFPRLIAFLESKSKTR